MSRADGSELRIAVVGGGPAGSFFALYALKYARQAGREVSVTIYEGKDFRHLGQPGCNMCAGLLPMTVVRRLADLDLTLPPALILGHITGYALHTSAGVLHATQPDAHAEVLSVYRGAGPRYGHSPSQLSFDETVMEEAIARGARLRRGFVERIRRGRPIEVTSAGQSEPYDLVVLAAGLNGRCPALEGFAYQPPPTAAMCQTELHLGEEEVRRRLGCSVHIFLPADEIATYGILIPKGAYVSASLLNPRQKMASLVQFLALPEVAGVIGARVRPACGCLPRISVGPARGYFDDGFVAVGDAAVTRLYKNGIGSALATAERAARTAIFRGPTRAAFAASYLPLCRAIDADNRRGRLLFLQVPLLKRCGALSRAHVRLTADASRQRDASVLHARILWGMFTGAYSYRQLLRMALHPGLICRLVLALGQSTIQWRRPVSASCPAGPGGRSLPTARLSGSPDSVAQDAQTEGSTASHVLDATTDPHPGSRSALMPGIRISLKIVDRAESTRCTRR